MDRKRYIFLSGIWVGVLALFILLFPFILFYLSKLMLGGHSGAGGAGGAVAAVIGMLVKPLGILVALISIGWISFKRITWLGLAWGWKIAVLLWLLGSMAFFVGLGNFWGANFGMGLLFVFPPFLPMFLLVFMVFLGFARRETSGDANPLLGLAAGMVAGYTMFILRGTIVSGIATIPILGHFFVRFWISVESIIRPFDVVVSFGLPGSLFVSLAIFTAILALIWLVENFTVPPRKTNTR